MRIECPWSVRGYYQPTSFSVDVSLISSDARELIENRVKLWWPSMEVERHEDMDGNSNIYLYENKEMFNECHAHGACLHTKSSVVNLRMVGNYAKLIIFDMDSKPLYMVDDIIQYIRGVTGKPEVPSQLNNIAS
jgi:hypothetical protein